MYHTKKSDHNNMKQYMKPQASLLKLSTESMLLAASYEVNSNKTTDQVLSNEKNWDSTNWSDTED